MLRKLKPLVEKLLLLYTNLYKYSGDRLHFENKKIQDLSTEAHKFFYCLIKVKRFLEAIQKLS